MDDADKRTVWCGNLPENITEELLYELFLQLGPVERVSIPPDKGGRKPLFGFVTFKHEVSVPYVVELLNGISLFNKKLNIKPRCKNVATDAPNPRDRSYGPNNTSPNMNDNNFQNILNMRNQVFAQHPVPLMDLPHMYPRDVREHRKPYNRNHKNRDRYNENYRRHMSY